MVAHTWKREPHNTVGWEEEGAHWVAETVAGEDLAGSFEKECKVSLQDGGLMKVEVGED